MKFVFEDDRKENCCMAKIDVINNKMAMFMICEAIGKDRDKVDFNTDENGLHDLKIIFNGTELNVEKFIGNLSISYQNAVKKQAAELLRTEYGEILDKVYYMQDLLEEHNKIFEGKVFCNN